MTLPKELEKKLRKLLPHLKYKGRDGKPHATYVEPTDEAIEQIAQAFEDAGYTNDIARKHFNDAFIDGIKTEAGLMTGKEWYDRYQLQLKGKGAR